MVARREVEVERLHATRAQGEDVGRELEDVAAARVAALRAAVRSAGAVRAPSELRRRAPCRLDLKVEVASIITATQLVM